MSLLRQQRFALGDDRKEDEDWKPVHISSPKLQMHVLLDYLRLALALCCKLNNWPLHNVLVCADTQIINESSRGTERFRSSRTYFEAISIQPNMDSHR